MIENKKPEIQEEEEHSVESDSRFFTVGFVVIGSILILMIICVIGIIVFENI